MDLEITKKRVSEKYLGKAGIHAIGCRSPGIVTVYHSGPYLEEWHKTIEEIRQEVGSFQLEIYEEQAPFLAVSKHGNL